MTARVDRAGPADFLEGVLRQALGDTALAVLEVKRVGGGCIHHAVRVRTTRGDWFA